MALFGSPTATIGVDLGTSTSKIVELVNRHRRIELTTYAESNMSNLLVNPPDGDADAIARTADGLHQMMERAGVSADSVVAALPGGVVFSTVLTLPRIPESEMEKAVRFAARDVVPADIDEMVLGWSRVGSEPHMATDKGGASSEEQKKQSLVQDGPLPVFITAAPKDVVFRYTSVFESMQMTLLALEVETFPLVRSLLSAPPPSALIVDIGSRATTFHIIDRGIPRVSHTIDFGGHDITTAIMQAGSISEEDAEQQKVKHGILESQDATARVAIESVVARQIDKAKDLLRLYEQKEGRRIPRSVLIGGGANLQGLSEYWTRELGTETALGNPWKGLAYPQKLEGVLEGIGPRFGVAVGLALRGCTQVAS
jgi:type IV pilus assembly protein PilM